MSLLAVSRYLRLWFSGERRYARLGYGLRLREAGFSQVQDFRALFAQLDARQTLWGSQKCYTARELKILINRVRTQNPTIHLPLGVIPETDGLRQRVQELMEVEVTAAGRVKPKLGFFGRRHEKGE